MSKLVRVEISSSVGSCLNIRVETRCVLELLGLDGSISKRVLPRKQNMFVAQWCVPVVCCHGSVFVCACACVCLAGLAGRLAGRLGLRVRNAHCSLLIVQCAWLMCSIAGAVVGACSGHSGQPELSGGHTLKLFQSHTAVANTRSS